MHFILDENVPASVSDLLQRSGHTAVFIYDYVPRASSDPVVATVSQELNAVLVSFDGDFQKIAPRIPRGERTRFRRLSRIWMRCNEHQASQRLEKALGLIEVEYQLVESGTNQKMLIWLSNSFIRTDR
jgi:predicted nuclease of predicted toxin-antitoxin system